MFIINYLLFGVLTCVYSISGTSNIATTTFTINNNNAHSQTMVKLDVLLTDNGTQQVASGRLTMSSGSNLATFTKGGTGVAFTNTGTKSISGQFQVRI